MRKLSIVYFSFLVLINCSNDNSINPQAVEVIGKWNLESVKIIEYGSTTTLTSPDATGSITFTNSGYSLSLNIEFEGQCESTTGTGKYNISGNTISFFPTWGNGFTGTVNGYILIITYEKILIKQDVLADVTYQFKKEGI